jgi:hypothetical protein
MHLYWMSLLKEMEGRDFGDPASVRREKETEKASEGPEEESEGGDDGEN